MLHSQFDNERAAMFKDVQTDVQTVQSEDANLLENVRLHFSRSGIAARFARDVDGYEDYGTLLVQTDKDTLSAAIEEKTASVRFMRAWQNFCAEPETAYLWGVHFSQYVRVRWTHGDVRDIEMLPLVQAAKDGAQFDLTDALTKTYWLEYLSEFQERRAHWQAFEAANGQTTIIG